MNKNDKGKKNIKNVVKKSVVKRRSLEAIEILPEYGI